MNPRLDMIGLIADDLTRTLAFYRHLGLEFPADAEQRPHVEATLSGGIRIAWDTVETIRSIEPDWTPSEGGRISLAFLCEDAADVDATYERLVGLGYTGQRKPWDAFWGQRYAIVDDPDGNPTSLFAPLDG